MLARWVCVGVSASRRRMLLGASKEQARRPWKFHLLLTSQACKEIGIVLGASRRAAVANHYARAGLRVFRFSRVRARKHGGDSRSSRELLQSRGCGHHAAAVGGGNGLLARGEVRPLPHTHARSASRRAKCTSRRIASGPPSHVSGAFRRVRARGAAFSSRTTATKLLTLPCPPAQLHALLRQPEEGHVAERAQGALEAHE